MRHIFAISLSLAALLPARAADFQRDIRPILSDACFHCHGPDKNTRMAGLRLDTREGAFEKRKNGVAIVPGDPAASLLYQRIAHQDAARRMPPAHANKILTAEQKDLLKGWIEQGAPWQEHWAFIAPARPAEPAVRRRDWIRNPIDSFILARLEAAGLQPAPEAGRRTLIRRLSLDITGLPPSPAEVEAFVNDSSPGAYEKAIDRLLASPHYGEHRARYWLDAARYADTHGLHIDNYREMWPYRDWVINAFNRNIPFDRFTLEQLAGDLLPDHTLEQQIASGFHRCNVTTNEGGAIVEEVEAIYAKDRVETTSTVWMGLTVGCAACHDHKFDPIPQKDFYSLAAFFRNTTQNAMDGNIPDTPPIIVVPEESDRERWFRLTGEEKKVAGRMEETEFKASDRFSGWLGSESLDSIQTPLDSASELLSLSFDGDPSVVASGRRTPLLLPHQVEPAGAGGLTANALRFGKNGWLELPNVGHIRTDKPFSVTTWIYFPEGEDNFTIASQSDPRDKNRGWTIEINARVPSMRLVADDGKGIQVRVSNVRRLKHGNWYHLAFTYDGKGDQLGLSLYVNGEAIPTEGRGDQVTGLQGEISTSQPLRLAREDKRFFQGGIVADFRVFDRVLSLEEARLVSQWPALRAAGGKQPASLTGEERQALRLYYLIRKDPQYRGLAADLQALREERLAIRRRGSVTHVMAEKESKPMARILHRGQYDQPRDTVEPHTPTALPPLPDSYPRNRLGLARWLTDPSNPLTARVTVNRFWQEIFGTGLVKTSEDFGSQGEPPSHPELLDWLAVEFRDSGWDMKKLFRLILTSSAYRQSAAAGAGALEKDPENRLLSRGPRFRMDAEMVRDYALAAGGLLRPVIGGPSVKPYQPDGIWETVAMNGSNTRFYRRDGGENLYRRSLYTFWKRSAPPPAMDIFNAPTRENCTVRRERTNTPLQALATMNDVQYVEAARNLAQQVLQSAPGDFTRQLDLMTERLLSRRLQDKERAVAERAHKDFLSYYDSHPADAGKLIAVGESKAHPGLPVVETAALTMVANQLMNLDEVLNK